MYYFLGDALGSVRAVVQDSEDAPVMMTRDYAPYGEVLAGQGTNPTPYGFTGEMFDAQTGLVFLRARYYNPMDGRFINKDTWQGNYTRSQSLNRWSYVEANPINYTDPSGRWRWWLSSSMYHLIIETYYEGLPVNPLKQLEYPIPGTPFRHPDMFNSALGDVYEIEPWYLQSTALSQATGYVNDLLFAAAGNLLTGDYYGVPYDWNATPFHVGTGVDWPGKFRAPMPGFLGIDLVADYVGSGTVTYWLEPNALSLFGALPFLVPNKRLVRPPNWTPGQYAQQPAYAISMYEACGYALVFVGGTIIVVTIIEDVATLGVGTFDDAVTVPAGILFIDVGQRIAVLASASVP